MRIRISILLLAVALLAPEGLQAQLISKKGTASGQFLLIPVGARPSALGGAVTASLADATAMYWNPGALAGVKKRELIVEHASWIADLQHNYVGLAIPVPNVGVIGLSVVALTMDDMEETTFEQEDGTGVMFGASFYAVGLTVSRYLLSDFSIGATFKYVNERIMNTSASGFGVDVGTSYVTPFDGLRFGVRIANFGQKLNLSGDDLITTVDIDPNVEGNNNRIDAYLRTKPYAMPLMLQVGLAYDPIKTDVMRATVMADALSPSDNNQSVNVGAELSFYNDLFSLQAGLPELGLADRMWKYAAGGTVRYEMAGGTALSLGYAMQAHEYLGITNRLSVKMNF